jgi:hypothetical protein
MQLALWLVNWRAIATRVLLHLRSRPSGEDEWGSVAVAAGGYCYTPSDKGLDLILLRLKELNLIEWELAGGERSAPRSERLTRIARLTGKGQEVASAILKLAALLSEEDAARGS